MSKYNAKEMADAIMKMFEEKENINYPPTIRELIESQIEGIVNQFQDSQLEVITPELPTIKSAPSEFPDIKELIEKIKELMEYLEKFIKEIKNQ